MLRLMAATLWGLTPQEWTALAAVVAAVVSITTGLIAAGALVQNARAAKAAERAAESSEKAAQASARSAIATEAGLDVRFSVEYVAIHDVGIIRLKCHGARLYVHGVTLSLMVYKDEGGETHVAEMVELVPAGARTFPDVIHSDELIQFSDPLDPAPDIYSQIGAIVLIEYSVMAEGERFTLTVPLEVDRPPRVW